MLSPWYPNAFSSACVIASASFEPRAEEHQVRKECGTNHIHRDEQPQRRVRRPFPAVRQKHERANHEVRLIACDNCATVDAAERGTSRRPVGEAKSDEGASEQLHEDWWT